jgi:hypothetical protein
VPEIWENPFGNAHLKVERANKHIADIEERLRTSADAEGPSLHIDGKTGEQFLYYRLTDRELRSDIALMVGDAVHNLHCALDIAWCAAIRSIFPQSDSRWAKFPVYKNRHELESALTKSRKIPASSPLFDLVVNRVKCYQGGDADICALHDLDIDDKHNLLIPMLAVIGVNGVELEDENGLTSNLAIALTRPNSYRRQVPLGTKIKNHGKAIFRVTFSDGTPLKDIEVIPTLQRFSAKVLAIVRALQRIEATHRWQHP